MSLHMRLRVNGDQIGYLIIRRLEPGCPTGNDICHYEWTLNINGKTLSNLDETPVEHRFRDGAWTLVARVIEAAGLGPTELDA
jgi:hypothetical protein